MHGVGGELSAHPDFLFSVLTPEQWAGWISYTNHFTTPMRRADLNTQVTRWDIRAAAGDRKTKLKDLAIRYGKKQRSRQMSTTQMLQMGMAMATKIEKASEGGNGNQ